MFPLQEKVELAYDLEGVMHLRLQEGFYAEDFFAKEVGCFILEIKLGEFATIADFKQIQIAKTKLNGG
jgi:hypothetical protein